MKTRIVIPAEASRFQEDKDLAREIRTRRLLPALERGKRVELDFSQVGYTTQSFVHALIGEVLKKHGEEVLDRIDFRNCSPQLRNVIQLVVSYSLGGFASPEVPAEVPVAVH